MSLSNRETRGIRKQPPTPQPGVLLYTYKIYTSKYLLSSGIYTKGDLNLKWLNQVFVDILKLVFLCTQLEKLAIRSNVLNRMLTLVSRSF